MKKLYIDDILKKQILLHKLLLNSIHAHYIYLVSEHKIIENLSKI